MWTYKTPLHLGHVDTEFVQREKFTNQSRAELGCISVSLARSSSGATKKRLRRRATIYIVKSLPGPSPTSAGTQLHFVVLAFFSIERFCLKVTSEIITKPPAGPKHELIGAMQERRRKNGSALPTHSSHFFCIAPLSILMHTIFEM